MKPTWIKEIEERLDEAREAGMQNLVASKSNSNKYMDAVHDECSNTVCLVGASEWETQNQRSEFIANADKDIDTLLKAYKQARKAIEDGPHDPECDGWRGDWGDIWCGPCDCWKSQALNYNPTEVS